MDNPFEKWWYEKGNYFGVTKLDDLEHKAIARKAYQAGQKSCEPLIWQLIQHIDDKAGTDETEHDFVQRIKKEVENQIP
jgi:hypothetical protein